MGSKSLVDYQQKTKEASKGFDFNCYVRFMHLVEELGELGEAITVYKGDRKAGSGGKALADHSDLEEEFGDVLFSLIDIANDLKIDLSATMETTFDRYEKKLKENTR